MIKPVKMDPYETNTFYCSMSEKSPCFGSAGSLDHQRLRRLPHHHDHGAGGLSGGSSFTEAPRSRPLRGNVPVIKQLRWSGCNLLPVVHAGGSEAPSAAVSSE